MLSPYFECSHAIWSEVRSIAAHRFVVYFDDGEVSDTYAEPILSCPGCGRGLVNHVVLEHGPLRRPNEE
jgi:hypothetical protein